jgi:hypothetical protein
LAGSVADGIAWVGAALASCVSVFASTVLDATGRDAGVEAHPANKVVMIERDEKKFNFCISSSLNIHRKTHYGSNKQ